MREENKLRTEFSRGAVLAFGSNLGDRFATLTAAINEVRLLDGVVVERVSDCVETPALTIDGIDRDKPSYLNVVASLHTSLTPHELLSRVNGIEEAHGRVREVRWGNRTLDIDIVTFDGLEMSDEQLTLPHPSAWERGFVLLPWLQIDPDAFLPGHGPIADLVKNTTDTVDVYGTDKNGLRP